MPGSSLTATSFPRAIYCQISHPDPLKNHSQKVKFPGIYIDNIPGKTIELAIRPGSNKKEDPICQVHY